MTSEVHRDIEVEVAYASPTGKCILKVMVARESSISDAISQSKILDKYPEIDLDINKVGVFAKVIKDPAKTILLSGDRVEIYRPLTKAIESTKKAKS